MKNGYRLYSSLGEVSSVQKYAQIDLGALRNNYRVLCACVRTSAPTVRAIAVVKADAYGHGAEGCVCALLREGCDFFAVSCIEEALAVRRACDEAHANADVLILGYTDPQEVARLSEYRILQTVVSAAHAAALNDFALREGVILPVHAAINTGMNRIGLEARGEEEIERTAEELLEISGMPSLCLCGMFTHFASADEDTPEGIAATERQLARYRTLREKIEARGLKIPFHHVCNSAASVRGGAQGFDGVRFGILLYGACPLMFADASLSPVMRLCARISHIHSLPPGERVGYGGTYSAQTERVVGTIGIGYADGWIRAYRDATVLLHTASGDYSVPLVGRICMDQCMVDLTGTDARIGDTVTLFGADRNQLAALSERAGTIDYEGLCLISSRVLRFYTD